MPVDDRTESTLLAIIQRYVQKGSIIHTDCFASYNTLKDNGYRHLTVNHSENFVDPETGACTNQIESTWWAVRRGLPSNSAHKNFMAMHLAEYIWRKKHRNDDDVFLSLVASIAEVYQGVSAT